VAAKEKNEENYDNVLNIPNMNSTLFSCHCITGNT